jgi:hypothetical protein
MKCVLIFSTNFVRNLRILRSSEGNIIKKYIGLHVNSRYSCQILMKLAISGQMF